LGIQLFREGVAILLEMIHEGDTAAELLLLYYPRVFACKGLSFIEALEALCEGAHPRPRLVGMPDNVRWAKAVEAALERPTKVLLDRLDADLGQPAHVGQALTELLHELHPPQPLDDEWTRWGARADAVQEPRFSPRDLRRWAHASALASGGECGWTGQLVRHLHEPGGALFNHFSAWAARPPRHWNCIKTAVIATRMLTGWVLPRPGKTPRPIAAPTFVRRVGTRVVMRRARKFAERFCVARGQLGLSGEKECVAYTALANTALRQGGMVASDDLTASYTKVRRAAAEESVRALMATAVSAEDTEAVGALCVGMTDYIVADPHYDPADPRSLPIARVNFKELEEALPVFGLAQGCTFSGLVEAVTIAHQTPTPPREGSSLTLGNHDDRLRMAGPRVQLPERPDCGAFGGVYSTDKADAVTAAEMKEGQAITVWGRPVGDVAAWMDGLVAKARERLLSIRRLSTLAPGTAIAALMRLGGPHGLIMHALKGVPPDEYSDRWLEALEADFASVVLDVMGPGVGRWAEPGYALEKVFGQGSPFAGSSRAARVACVQGLGLAVDGTLRLIGAESALRLADTLAGGLLEKAGVQRTVPAIMAYVEGVVEREQRLSRPASGNLWFHALGARQDLGRIVDDAMSRTAAWTERDKDDTARVALAVVLGYPVKAALGIERERCTVCEVQLDDNLHHLNQCKVSVKGPRHDNVATDLVVVGQVVGARTAVHNERIPYLPSGKRPVDFVERVAGGLDNGIDLTIVLPDNVEAAAASKHRKYDELLRGSGFKCVPMAIGLDGSVHGEADEVFQRWRGLWGKATRDAGEVAAAHAAHAVNVEIGIAFARRCVQAMRIWDERLKALLLRTTHPGGGRRTRARRPAEAGAAVKRPRRAAPTAGCGVRGAIPQALLRERERLEGRWDLANVPLGLGGLPVAGPNRPGSSPVSPVGHSLRADLTALEVVPPLGADRR
jgi:hypothetical protein